jgi:VanZ family protein
MAGIFYVSSLHQAPLPEGVGDKPAHSLAYFGLAAVIARALAGGLPVARIGRRIVAAWPPRITFRQALAAFAIAVAYGATDEFHQRFVAGRSADLLDLRADAIGAALSVLACWAWSILFPVSNDS